MGCLMELIKMKIFNKRTAFTLSEVMITISLIGFIATMTLSTLGSSIQQRARLAEFRTAYAKMDAALRSISIDEGKIYACYLCPTQDDKTTYGLTMNGCTAQTSQCKVLTDAFVRAMGATRFCENNPITEGCIPNNYPKPPGGGCFQSYTNGRAYVLDNSMMIITDGGNFLRQFAVDVNGRKGPNKWGQDIFTFAVKATGSKTVLGRVFITDLSILPPETCLPGKSNDAKKTATKSSDQMLMESMNYKK